MAGRLVRTLHDGVADGGWTELIWDARDDDGRPVAAGLYFVRLTAAGASRTGRVVVSRQSSPRP